MPFELYPDDDGRYRWRFVDREGRGVASSEEAYSTKSDAADAVDAFRRDVQGAEVPPGDEEDPGLSEHGGAS